MRAAATSTASVIIAATVAATGAPTLAVVGRAGGAVAAWALTLALTMVGSRRHTAAAEHEGEVSIDGPVATAVAVTVVIVSA